MCCLVCDRHFVLAILINAGVMLSFVLLQFLEKNGFGLNRLENSCNSHTYLYSEDKTPRYQITENVYSQRIIKFKML